MVAKLVSMYVAMCLLRCSEGFIMLLCGCQGVLNATVWLLRCSGYSYVVTEVL